MILMINIFMIIVGHHDQHDDYLDCHDQYDDPQESNEGDGNCGRLIITITIMIIVIVMIIIIIVIIIIMRRMTTRANMMTIRVDDNLDDYILIWDGCLKR